MKELERNARFSKEFDEVIEVKEKKKYIPPMTHPWKLSAFKKQLDRSHNLHQYAWVCYSCFVSGHKYLIEIEVNNAKHECNELVIDFYEISYKITNKNENISRLCLKNFKTFSKTIDMFYF